MERVLGEMGNDACADQFKGYDWETEEGAFMVGYNQGNPEVTYERLRTMGNNGVQEPVVGFENDALVGTKRLYADGYFDRHGRDDKKALFCAAGWRGWQAPGNVVNTGVNELVLPDYKHTWGNIRKLTNATLQARSVSFKSKEYKA